MRLGILASAAAIMVASAQAAPNADLAFAIGQCAAVADAKARLSCFDGIAAQLKTGIALPAGAAPPPVAQAPSPTVQAAQTPQAAPQKGSGSWYDPTEWFGRDDRQQASNNPADFGAEAVRKPAAAATPAEPEPLQEITAHVTSASFGMNGRFTIALDNGQVWRQLDADTGIARFSKKGGDTVTISRGFLGSYNLVMEGHSVLFRVKRVQ